MKFRKLIAGALAIIQTLFFVPAGFAQSTKLSALPAITSPANTDLMYVVVPGSGTPDRHITFANLRTSLGISGLALTSGTLGQFGATSSAQLAGVISDETGTGLAVFNTNPVFTTGLTVPQVTWTGAVKDLTGTGTPEGAITAGIGSTYRRLDGSASTSFYVKESGTGNTGWIAFGSPSGTGAPSTATYITQTPNGGLSNEQAMSALATGLVKNTTSTGVQSIAVVGVDYWSPISAIPITGGGTGAITAPAARANFGLTINSDIQAHSIQLDALASTVSSADRLAYYTGVGTADTTNFTAFGRNFVGTANSITASALLGLGTMASQSSSSYLLISGGTLTGQLIASNLGVFFTASDTNPSCSAGLYGIYADLSELKLKQCQNGVASDVGSGGGGSGDIDGVTAGTGLTGGGSSGSVTLDVAVTAPVELIGDTVGCSDCGLISGHLGQFAATTSAQLAANLTNETGTGVAVFGTAPTFTTSITTPKLIWTGTVQDLAGAGTPEAAVTAPVGSVYRRTDGGATTTLYIKESGAGNTGWVPYGNPAGTGAPTDATFITATANGSLSDEFALGTLATGLLKNTTTTGIPTIAVEGTDYYKPGGVDVAVIDGGSGASTAAGARTNFGLGTIATQNSNSVTITGGSITGITALTVLVGGTGLTSGTSGGVPYFNSSTTMASSAALTANRLLLGGGAGVAPTVVGSLGTTVTVLHGNASGAPTFGAVSLTADVSGTLPFTSGGFGIATATSGGVPYFASSTTVASSAALTVNEPVIGGGAGSPPSVGTRSGNSTVFVTTTGAQTSGRCVEIDGSGNHIQSAAGCASGTNNVTAASTFGTDNVVLRSDGTGRGSQGSLVSISDGGDVTATSFAVGGAPTSTCGTAGCFQLGEGTAPSSFPPTSITVYSPASVPTSYGVVMPSAAATGFVKWTNSSNTVTESIVPISGAGASILTSDGIINIASGKTLTISNTMTQTATDGSTISFGAGGTVAYTSNNLSVFGATTSAQFASVLSDETGSGGGFVRATAPTITGGTFTALTTFALRDTSAPFDVTIAAVSSTGLTAGRILTLDMVNAARSIKLQGNIDLGGNLTTAGALITSGANSLTLTTTGATNVIFPTTGTLITLAGAETLTNKALDAEGTGNVVTLPFEEWKEVAACSNVTASLIFNVNTAAAPAATCEGTNTRIATADFDDTTDEGIDYTWRLGTGFTGAIDFVIRWKAAATSGAVGWCVQLVRVPTSATSDPALPAQAAGNCTSTTVAGTTLQEVESTISGVTCTSCVAGDRLNVRVTRDANGGAVTDSMTGDAKMIGFTQRYRRAL